MHEIQLCLKKYFPAPSAANKKKTDTWWNLWKMSNDPSLTSVLWRSYCANTDSLLKMIDCFLIYFLAVRLHWNPPLIFCLADCEYQVAAFQGVYCVVFGSYPFNAFLAGFMSSIGMFILTGFHIATLFLEWLHGWTWWENLHVSLISVMFYQKDIHCLIPIVPIHVVMMNVCGLFLTCLQKPVSLRSQVNPANNSDFENEGTNKPISKVRKWFPPRHTTSLCGTWWL